jgi:hypothetical protein
MIARAIEVSIISPDKHVQNTEDRKTQLNPELAHRKAGNTCTAVRVAIKADTMPSTIKITEIFFTIFPPFKSGLKSY